MELPRVSGTARHLWAAETRFSVVSRRVSDSDLLECLGNRHSFELLGPELVSAFWMQSMCSNPTGFKNIFRQFKLNHIFGGCVILNCGIGIRTHDQDPAFTFWWWWSCNPDLQLLHKKVNRVCAVGSHTHIRPPSSTGAQPLPGRYFSLCTYLQYLPLSLEGIRKLNLCSISEHAAH